MTTPPSSTSIDYFQRLGLEETFSRLFHVFGQRWGVFLSISVLAYLLIWAVSMMTIFLFVPLLANAKDNEADDAYGMLPIHYMIVLLIDTAVYYAIMCIADGAIIRSVAEMYIHRVPNVHDTLQYGLQKLGPLFCTAMLIGLALGIPFGAVAVGIALAAEGSSAALLVLMIWSVIFICVLIWVTVVTYHVYPSIMVENQGIMGSIRRSWELSTGHRCYIFTALLLFTISKMILRLVAKAVGYGGNEGADIVASVLIAMLNVLFASLGSM